jgi:beta-galactosidase GanA
VFTKFTAAGLNAVSIYVHWGLVNPSNGVIDFEGFRALDLAFKAARDAGLWVVLRPGPYINAETSAGGIAHWVTSEVAGHLRTNETNFYESWQDYIRAVIAEVTPWQITEGGPVIGALPLSSKLRR